MRDVKQVVLQIEASRAYGRSLLAGIANYSKRFGPWSFHHQEPFYTDTKFKTVKQIIDLKPDGVITRYPKDVEKLRQHGIPTIIAIHIENDIPGVPNVKGDNGAMGAIAAEHLLNRGYHNFAYCGFEDMFWSRDRRISYEQKIHDAGFEVLNFHRPKRKKTVTDDTDSLVEWILSLPKPIAVLACNDDRAKQFIEAAKIAQVKIPDDIAVLGIDNDEVVCDLCYPSLSSVKLTVERAGYDCAKLLDDMMSEKKIDTQQIIVAPTGVITRETTDVYCVHDKEVAAALRYIRQNSRNLLQVSDVAEVVNLSKRSLQIRFREALGYSVYERIKREKVRHMVEMLSETNMTILDIAHNLGFESINHISRFFKQEKGLTPLEFRKQFSNK